MEVGVNLEWDNLEEEGKIPEEIWMTGKDQDPEIIIEEFMIEEEVSK